MKRRILMIATGLVAASLLVSGISVTSYSICLNEERLSAYNSGDVPNHTGSNRGPVWYYKPSSYAQLVSWYQSLEANFSDYIEVFKANDLYGTGQATGGYDLYYVRITNESLGFHKPEVLFLGSPHGDETTGTIGLYWFVDWLMRMAFTDEPCPDYSKDWLRWLIDNREIYIEISHNPYGFDYIQRYDGNGWDLNREADFDGPGTPTGGIWGSENGKTLRRFVDNHTIRIGCDFHGGTRMILYPWAETHTSVHGTSPISGETYSAAPPDFYFYDASSLRLGSYMGNAGGDGYLNENNIGTINELIWYPVYGGISPWAYGADVVQNPVEDPYVEDEIFGNYPGAGILWISPEMSYTKNPPESTFGNDTTLGWGTEVRRFALHQIDLAQPYVRWQPATVENHIIVPPGTPLTFEWQVNGSMVVDHTYIQWGSNPDPINNYDHVTSDYDGNAGNYLGGTGWDNAYEGSTNGVTYSENITITTPGDYYFVAKAQVDQIYANVLSPSTYGNNSYLRLIKERTNDSYYNSINGTDGLEEIIGQTWWYSPIIHVTISGNFYQISTLTGGWNFVSLPFNSSVNKSQMKVSYGGMDYTWADAVSAGVVSDYIFGWDRVGQSYTFSDTLESGYGYWMYAYQPCELLVENISVIQDSYITHLESEWNVMGVPSNQTYNKTDLLVECSGSNYNWSEAVNAGILSEYVFGWNRTSHSYMFSDIFEPGYCYWMYAYQECTIRKSI